MGALCCWCSVLLARWLGFSLSRHIPGAAVGGGGGVVVGLPTSEMCLKATFVLRSTTAGQCVDVRDRPKAVPPPIHERYVSQVTLVFRSTAVQCVDVCDPPKAFPPSFTQTFFILQ